MQVNAYLFFDGNCREAFEFYARATGARIARISTYGEAPGCENMPEADQAKIMHVRLDGEGWSLMGSDATQPESVYKGIEGVSLAVGAKSAAEAERVFNALAEGGQVTMPLGKTFWSESFGMLKDRFGLGWMVNFELPPA